MLKVSFVVLPASDRVDPAASSAFKSVNAHPGLTTAAAVTQTFNGWIRPAACASIGVR